MPGPQKLARAAAEAGWVAALHHDTVELTNTGYRVIVDIWYDEGQPVEIRSLVGEVSTPLDHLIPILQQGPEKFLRALEADALRVSGDERTVAAAEVEVDVTAESVRRRVDGLTERDDINSLPLPAAAKAYARRKGLKSMLRQPKDFAHVNHLIMNPTWKKNRFQQHAVGTKMGGSGGMKESVRRFVARLLDEEFSNEQNVKMLLTQSRRSQPLHADGLYRRGEQGLLHRDLLERYVAGERHPIWGDYGLWAAQVPWKLLAEAWTPERKKQIEVIAATRGSKLVDHFVVGDYDLALWHVEETDEGPVYVVSINNAQFNPVDPNEQQQKHPESAGTPPLRKIAEKLKAWVQKYGSVIVGSVVPERNDQYRRILQKLMPEFTISPYHQDDFRYGFRLSK